MQNLRYALRLLHLHGQNSVRYSIQRNRFIKHTHEIPVESHVFLPCLKRHASSIGKLFKCWKCSKFFDGYELKCPHCNVLQSPPTDESYFSLFDLDVFYDIDGALLKKDFLKLQAEFHPDKFSNRDERERLIAEEISSFINAAYTTLSNPYKRGLYLLKINKIVFNENEIQLDTSFLSEIMELNEEVDSIKSKSDLNEFESRNNKEINNLSNEISEALNLGNYALAKECLQKMKYFITINDRLKEHKLKLL